MRIAGSFALIVALLVVSAPLLVRPAVADDADTCWKGTGEERIAACTRAINSRRWRGRDLAWAYVNRGHAFKNQGDRDRAIADYNKAILLDPQSRISYLQRSATYYDKGDFDRAIADASAAIRLDPKDAAAYEMRGTAYDSEGNRELAIADYSEAIRLDPNVSRAYYNRGLAYHRKGGLDQAIADFTEAIRLDPNDADSHASRGAVYLSKGDLDRAIADCTEAIRLDPKHADAYRHRGVAWLYAGNLAEALADERRASEINPKDAYNALWLDIIGQRSNVPSRLTQAISQIDMTTWPAPVIRMYLGQTTPVEILVAADDPDARKKKGQMCEANFYSGELALRQDAKDEAMRLFGLAVSDCPPDFDERAAADAQLKANRAALATAATQQGYDDCNQTSDLDRGIAACTRIVNDQTQSAVDRVLAYLKRGNANVAKDNLDGAIADYGEAIRLDPQNIVAYGSRAIAYSRKGKRDDAIADYRRANAINGAGVAEMAAANAELKEIAAAAAR